MSLSIARSMVAGIGLISTGGLFADFIVEQTAALHMRNPLWPPHAKFHNGQGIITGVLTAGLTEWLLFGPFARDVVMLVTAAMVAAIFWISMVTAHLLDVGAAPAGWRGVQIAA